MTTITAIPESLSFAELPALGEQLAGGEFAALTSTPDGEHFAVVLLPERGEGLTHQQATEWAASVGGVLPSRPMAALLYANCRTHLRQRSHWTSEIDKDDASCAWLCRFNYGNQFSYHRSWQACAVAVRLIPISA